MDNILDRNTSKSEVIGRCGRDEQKWMTTQNGQAECTRSNAKKTKTKKTVIRMKWDNRESLYITYSTLRIPCNWRVDHVAICDKSNTLYDENFSNE